MKQNSKQRLLKCIGKVYEQAQQQAGGGAQGGYDPNAQGGYDAGAQGQPKDDVVDADYEVVDDNK